MGAGTMISTELLDELQQLDRYEKLTVIQILASELAVADESSFQFGTNYDVWSPFDAPEAASVLLEMLDDSQNRDG